MVDANLNPLYDTDWQDEVFQHDITQNHSLSFTDGNEQTRVVVYLNDRDEDGTMKSTWFNRHSGRFVIESKINNCLSVGGSINDNKQPQRFLTHWGMRAVCLNLLIMR